MKKVLTIAPMQHVEAGHMTYNAVNNGRLQYDVPTCFPVLPLIHGYVGADEEVEVFVLTAANHETALENYTTVSQAIARLCAEIGARCTVSRIDIPFDDTVETHLSTFRKLIGLIAEGDILLADMTYGSKCLAIVLMMALNYGYRACMNCVIDCFVYGSMDFRAGQPCGRRIYDITPLFLMDQIVNELAESRNKNPLKAIESILNMNSDFKDED
ncbi:MAG: hypothetical protein ACSW8J_00930 [bacterium]